jgi:hypothetical protein
MDNSYLATGNYLARRQEIKKEVVIGLSPGGAIADAVSAASRQPLWPLFQRFALSTLPALSLDSSLEHEIR